MIRTKILLAATAACAIAVSADVIEFKSGSKLTGKVVRIEGGDIMFDADDVGSVKIAQDKVARMTTDKANTIQYKDMSTEDDGIWQDLDAPEDYRRLRGSDNG